MVKSKHVCAAHLLPGECIVCAPAPQVTTAKPDWETALCAWVDSYTGDEMRAFKAGFEAHASQSERAISAGRKLLLAIGGNCEESWQQNDRTFERAAELAEALALVVGRPEFDEETGEYKYAPEETK